MAGVWTRTGIEKLKNAITTGQPVTFSVARLNVSDAPIGSIELDPSITDLPNPYGSFVPQLQYDVNTYTLSAEIVVPPYYGFPPDKFVNGIGLYIDDTLAYVEQIIPRRIPNNGYTRFKIKINLENYQGAIDTSIIAFSYNAGESEKVTIAAGGSYSKAFPSPIKEVSVYKETDTGYVKNPPEIEVTLSSDLRTATLKNTSDTDVNLYVFYLVDTTPLPDNVTLEQVERIISPIYVGSQPPAPTDGYKIMFYTPSSDLYFANTDLNRWESVTEDIREKVRIFWHYAVKTYALDLSGEFGLYNYLIDDCMTFELWDTTKSVNVLLYKDAIYFEAFKGTATLYTKKLQIDSDSPVDLQFVVGALGKRKDLMKFYYNYGSGDEELTLETPVTLSNVSELYFKIEVLGDPAIRLSPALYGFVIISNYKLNIVV